MTNSYTIGAGDGADALSQNQQHRRGDGYGVVDPDSGTAAVTIGTGSLGQADTLSVAAGDVLVDGTTHTLTATDVQIDISNTSDPRRDVVYVDTAGAVQVAKGEAEATQPGDEDLTRFQYFRPTPPDLEGTKATVLAEVWVAADTGSVAAADLNDRRMSSVGSHSLDFDPVRQAELDTHETNVSAHHSPITLNLGDDGANESVDLSELAVSGTDPNGIFSEPTVDKLLIDPAQNWPAADDVPDSAVDHDATTNFSANEHIDHASVSITAGDGLAGGGDLTASRTLDLALDIEDGGTDVGDGTFWGLDLGTNLSGTDNGDGTVTVDSSASGGTAVEVAEDGTSLTTDVTLIDVLSGLTASEPTADEIDLAVDETEVDHDALLNFIANEHIDHSSVSISAGNGLAGGGDLTATRTLDLALDIEDGGTDVGDGTFFGLDFGTDLSVTDNADGTATVDSTASGSSGVDVENTDGVSLVSGATAIQAGTDLSFTDDGDGTATLDSSASGGTTVHGDWINVVDDLGMDDTGTTAVDTIFDNNIASETTLYFPEGTYLFDQGHYNPDLVDTAIVGDNATILIESTFSVNPTTSEQILFNFGQGGSSAGENIQVRGFTVDMTAASSGCAVIDGYVVGQHCVYEDIDVVGQRDDDQGTGVIMVNLNMDDPEGHLLAKNIRLLDGGSTAGTAEYGAFHVASSTEGTVVIHSCQVDGWQDNGYYMSNASTGRAHLLYSYAKDCGVAAIRPGGESTHVFGCHVIQTDTAPEPNFAKGIRLRNGNATVERCYVERQGTVSAEMLEITSHPTHAVVRDCVFTNASTAAAHMAEIESGNTDPRVLDACKFVTTAVPSASADAITNAAADVTYRDCVVDVVGSDASNHWTGLANTGSGLSVRGGTYRADDIAIDDNGGADVLIADIDLAEAVTSGASGVDLDGADPAFRGRVSNVVNGIDSSGATRPDINGTVLDSGTADAPTPGDYEPGTFVEWTDTTDGSGDGTYLVSHDGTAVTGPL